MNSNADVSALSGFSDIVFPVHQGDKELFSVMKDGKYGCITRSGDTVVPFEYEKALGNSYDVVAVKKDGKWGLLSASNSLLIPTEYANLILPSEREAKHFWVMKADSLYYHMNLTTNKVSAQGYKSASNFTDGIALVAPAGMKVEDTQVNRAQMYAPNTPKTTLDKLDITKSTDSFGYLLNKDDVLLIDLPVSTLYKDKIAKEIEKRGGKALTETEKKNILLETTRENRSYDLESTLSEDEWNY